MYKQTDLKLTYQVIIVQKAAKVIVMPLLRKNNFGYLLNKGQNTWWGGSKMRKYLHVILASAGKALVHLLQVSLEGIIVAIVLILLGIN